MWTSSCWTANIGKALQLVCHTEDQLFVPNLWDVVNFFRFIWFCQFEIVKGLSILGHCPGVQQQCGWGQVPGTSNRQRESSNEWHAPWQHGIPYDSVLDYKHLWTHWKESSQAEKGATLPVNSGKRSWTQRSLSLSMSCAIAKQGAPKVQWWHTFRGFLHSWVRVCGVWGDGGQWKRREEKRKKQRTCKEQVQYSLKYRQTLTSSQVCGLPWSIGRSVMVPTCHKWQLTSDV